MAAIWGLIDKGHSITEQTKQKLKSSMKEFKIDRYEECDGEHVYFACGHQYVTKEAREDISPYYDEAKQIYFAADCFLYNRSQLIEELQKGYGDDTQKEWLVSGDAVLAYKAYSLWGEGFVEHLRGSFSFAIYKVSEQEMLLYTDHLAQRYLAYYYDKNTVCFSTVYQPLLAFLGEERIKLNKEWIAAAYTDCTADTIKIPGITVYEQIYQVEPGTYIKIDLEKNHIERILYWNPLLRKKKLPKLDDDGYRQLFLDTFSQVVNHMLRSDGETGICLSGGLDSSSVAAFAAGGLEKRGKNLYSYTSVPAKDFQFRNNRFYIENETEFILAQQRMYPNILPRFVDVSEWNCFSHMESYAKLYREPVKPVLNMVNIEGIFLKAEEDGCRIMLSGQNGNATISYGSILTYIYQKCLSGHFVHAYKEAKAFCKRRRVGKKKLLQVFCKTWKEEHCTPLVFGDDCLIKEEDLKRYHLLQVVRRIHKRQGTGLMDSKKQRQGFCYMPLVFQHMGFYDTYNSLLYGILSLDPTLTKDMIELCMALPVDCNVRNGKERRTVRDYMKGLVPDSILDNHEGRGVQGADYAHRVNRDWDELKEEVFNILNDPALREYLEDDKLREFVEEAKEKEQTMDKYVVAKLAVLTSLGYFLKIAHKI